MAENELAQRRDAAIDRRILEQTAKPDIRRQNKRGTALLARDDWRFAIHKKDPAGGAGNKIHPEGGGRSERKSA
jgi:hypothetical protein